MPESKQYYCPCCGQPMESRIWNMEFPDRVKCTVIVTCLEKDSCLFAGLTVTPNSANNAKNLAKYHVSKCFDVFTGEKTSG